MSTDDAAPETGHPATSPRAFDPAVRAFVAEHRQQLVDELSEWLRIPSISADPDYAGEVSRSADWLAQRLLRAGFPTVEIWPTAGLPAVYAEWPSDDPDAPTVLVYGHHDVQPVDPVELWETAPFEPLVRATEFGEELVGRGAIDDKGQVYFHLVGLAAHLATTGRTSPAVNLKLIVEGEEESGSLHFAELLTRAPRGAALRRRRGERHRCLRPRRDLGLRRHARHGRGRARRARPVRRPALRLVRRCRPQPRHGAGPDRRPAARRRRSRDRCPASTTTSSR